MPGFYTVYIGCLFLAALLGLGLAIYALKHRETMAARPFAILMGLAAWWGLCAGLSAIAPTAEWAVFFGIPLRFTAVILVVPALFIFTLTYTGRFEWLTRTSIILLLIIPAISVLLAWSSARHNLFVYDVIYEQFDGFWLRTAWSKGIWFQVHVAYSYLGLLLVLFFLAVYAHRAQYPYRQQATLALGGSFLPIAASILVTFDLLANPDIDLIILSFIVMGVAFALALFNYQLLDMKPIARRTIVENMSDMVLVLDKRNYIVDVNGRVQNVLGYGRRQIIGHPVAEVFAQWVPSFQEYINAQEANTILTIPTENETTYLDLSITPLKPHSLLEGRLVVLRDVTHLKKTEAALQAALRNTEALYTVTQTISDFSHLVDILQTIVETIASTLPANRVTLIGFDLEQQTVTHFVKGGEGAAHVINVSYDELMDGLSGWVLREMKPALSPKDIPDPRESEQVHQRRIDSFCGSIIVVPLVYREQLLGTITAINQLDEPDFTENDVELMQAMANQAAVAIENGRLYEAEHVRVMELQESNQALNAFAQTVAHDLKNPLGLIVGFADLILMQNQQDEFSEQTLQGLQLITKQGYKMSSIIDSLLMLANLRKKQDIPLTAVNMASVVQEVLMRLSWQIKESCAEITYPDDWPIALGFSPWVEEIWANYISNAIKYGGNPPHIQLGAEKLQTGEYCFWVRDNGVGLTDEQQAQLFKEFSRLVEHHATDGHGLGLSIVEYIVRRLDGRVGVESELGVGSKFYFVLPAAPVPEQQLEQLSQ